MRVIKAEHLEAARPGVPTGVDVIFWKDLETVGTGGDISRASGFDDGVAALAPIPKNQPATLSGRRLARVCHDVVVGAPTEDHVAHRASTAIAMPIPPPMHSAATP